MHCHVQQQEEEKFTCMQTYDKVCKIVKLRYHYIKIHKLHKSKRKFIKINKLHTKTKKLNKAQKQLANNRKKYIYSFKIYSFFYKVSKPLF